jgi:hypothetical protein
MECYEAKILKTSLVYAGRVAMEKKKHNKLSIEQLTFSAANTAQKLENILIAKQHQQKQLFLQSHAQVWNNEKCRLDGMA